MISIILAAAVTLWQPPAAAPLPVKYLIQEWYVENDTCRGGSGAESDLACKLRDRTGRRVQALGWCYAERATSGADADWARCIRARR